MNKFTLNTPQKGRVRVIIFKDTADNTWYGVALEFNIVVSANSLELVNAELRDAVNGYVEAAAEIKGQSDHPYLNQKPIEEYEALWQALATDSNVPSPYQVDFFGMKSIHA